MSIDVYTVAFIVIIALAIAMPVVFFKGNNENVRRMKVISQQLESLLKPKDKVYELLGTSVGFRAIYTININRNCLGKAEALLILLPRQSLIYYPISKLTTKHDTLLIKLEITRKLNLQPFAIERKVNVCNELKIGFNKISINDIDYYYCGINHSLLDNMLNVLRTLRNTKSLIEISYINDILTLKFSSSNDTIIDDISKLLKIALRACL